MTRGIDEYLDVLFAYRPDQEPSLSEDDLAFVEESEHASCLEHGEIRGSIFEVKEEHGYRDITDIPLYKVTAQHVYFVEDPTYDESVPERLERLLDIVQDVYFAGDVRPAYVFGVPYHISGLLAESEGKPVGAETLANDEINFTLWLNVFSPPLVETYGRERLLDAPVWRVEEWKDGSILVVTDEQPLDAYTFGDLDEHLGLANPQF